MVKLMGKGLEENVIDTDVATYIMREERISKDVETETIKSADVIFSTTSKAKKLMEKGEPEFIEDFKESFPDTHSIAQELQKDVLFTSGPILVASEKEPEDNKVKIYLLGAATAGFFLWGAWGIRKIQVSKDLQRDLMTNRRNLLKAFVKIGIAFLSARELYKSLIELGKLGFVTLPETLPPEKVYGAILAKIIERMAETIKKQKKLGRKPVIYVILTQTSKEVVTYLKDGKSRENLLKAYKEFLDENLPQVILAGNETDANQIKLSKDKFYLREVYLYSYSKKWSYTKGELNWLSR